MASASSTRNSIDSTASHSQSHSTFSCNAMEDQRLTADEMDEKRKANIAYQYLCHLEEAKKWIEACVKEELPATTELEEGLRNGVYLAKLGHFVAPKRVQLKRIYDKEQTRYKASGLHFRHTDNINHWFSAMEEVGLPKIFFPETTDVYDRKNMPRVIYCVHALSLYLFKLGLAPQIQDLYGKINFTEEEISAMKKELEKYGIQMPSFSKIGGILTNELSVDDAALHAAIIAINEAIDKENPEETMKTLENPAAMLVSLSNEYANNYQDQLFQVKKMKSENIKNKTLDADTELEHDVYDEFLTQAEIQGNVNKINSNRTIHKIHSALLMGNKDVLLAALHSPHLSLMNVKDENIDYYYDSLLKHQEDKQNNNDEEVVLEKYEIQAAIDEANLSADSEYQKQIAILGINSALENSNSEQLMKSLQNPKAQLPPTYLFAAPLYLEELSNMKTEKQDNLVYEEIVGAINILSAVATINKSVDSMDAEKTFDSLCDEQAGIPDLDEHNQEKYLSYMIEAKHQKDQDVCPLLTHQELIDIVHQVNLDVIEQHECILAIGQINEAIDKGDPENTLSCLQMPKAKLNNVNNRQAYHYQVLLARAKDNKSEETGDEGSVLWINEIQSEIDLGNENADDAIRMSIRIYSINSALESSDLDMLQSNLQSCDAYLRAVTPDCLQIYMQKLQELKTEKCTAGEIGSHWMMNRTRDGHKFFYNTQTGEYSWKRTEDIIKDHSLLTRDEIQTVITENTEVYERELLFKTNENHIIQAQALVRAHLQKRHFQERLKYIKAQEPAVNRIQAYWKGLKQRRNYNTRLAYLNQQENPAVKIQAAARMLLARKHYRNRLKYFQDNEDAVVKIQAFMKSNLAKHDYRALIHDKNPPLSVIRKFLHLLETSDVDYAEELELQKLRQQVVTEIRSNQQLEHDLDLMDIKIGLLIKNRIDLQDVVSLNKKLTRHADRSSKGGLKALSKESHERLDTYQHLFYLLQTNPTYLAKLIFEMSQDRTTKFMESVIYSLFNYGSNAREEYLLIKLFKTALEEEIDSKVDKMTDIVTGNPLVVKMIVGFNRNQRGQNALRELLNPLICELVDDKNVKINTNPVEVYKAWINKMESETGKTSELPYDATPDEALEHEEVQKQIKHSINQLQQITDKFLSTILQSVDSIPYCMRYMAKVMSNCLTNKFPLAQEKDVLKIVGNLLYYRYINSAIVAPDAFDIISIGADKALTNDQRRNLGSVAKILQFAAANKGFGGDSVYLAGMNNYIRESHEKFKKYCLAACDVEEPEVKFNIDQYTDLVMITKPIVYISVQEIIDTHQLLLQHQDVIAPAHDDPLHELLEDLGEVPKIEELLGTDMKEDQDKENLLTQFAKTEISLTLTNKFDVPEDEMSDVKALVIRTKRLVIDVISCQGGDDLLKVLEIPPSDEQEEMHQAVVKKRDLQDQKVSRKEGRKITRNASILKDTRLSLSVMKDKIKKNLQSLELAGMVTRKNNYQDLLSLIAQDMRNQRRYRNYRKQELKKLKITLKSLNDKREFYESQVDYYNQYVKVCLENLKQQKSRKSRGFFKKEPSKSKSQTIKYTGAKLKEKGIVLEIEGLTESKFKDVLFEISSTPDPGLFNVNVKVLGASMDKIDLVFQDLLQLQYEGVAVMRMFNGARVNVNLLIFLLNKKFFVGQS